MDTKDFPRIQAIADKNQIADIEASHPELIKEIQTILKTLKLYKGSIDGFSGKLTTSALAQFKEERWLADPTKIGKSTAMALLEAVDGNHPVSEQMLKLGEVKNKTSSLALGELSGNSMKLPTGEIVFANQCIVAQIPLTWGEFTKDCTRQPESKEVVERIVCFAKEFGEIREKWGKPIGLTSGYRPPSVNRAIGGARYSRHMNGDAGDIYPIEGSIYELLEVVKASSACGIGLGMHRGFIHVDYRPTGRVVFSY